MRKKKNFIIVVLVESALPLPLSLPPFSPSLPLPVYAVRITSRSSTVTLSSYRHSVRKWWMSRTSIFCMVIITQQSLSFMNLLPPGLGKSFTHLLFANRCLPFLNLDVSLSVRTHVVWLPFPSIYLRSWAQSSGRAMTSLMIPATVSPSQNQ